MLFHPTARSLIVASNLTFLLLTSAISTHANPTLWPSGRGGHVLVYDEARGETLLIGGDSRIPSQTRDSVWAWNGVTWRVSDAQGPSWRTLPAAAFDRRNGRVILQGGRTKTSATEYGNAESDTWAWSGTGWEKLDVASPGPLDHHAVVYDVQRGVHVIQGGADGASMLPGDTWTFDGKAWSKAATAAAGPGQRVHHAMAYDSRRGRTVLFGGFGEDRVDARTGETWEWDGTRWERVAITGPSPRSRHRMAYDVARGVTIMFGGNDDPKTWAWDGRTWRTVAETGPTPRDIHAMTYDTRRERVVLYGGGRRSDLWEWDGKEWREIKRASE